MTQAPKEYIITEKQLEKMQPAHDAQVAKAASERMLDELGEGIDTGMISSGDCQYSDEPVVTVQALVKILKSLRAQQGGEP